MSNFPILLKELIEEINRQKKPFTSYEKALNIAIKKFCHEHPVHQNDAWIVELKRWIDENPDR